MRGTMQANQERVESQNIGNPQGGWITFPFLIVTTFGLGLALSGATSNTIVYLMNEYNIKSVDAAQISNIVAGCISLTPVVGAIIADAFFGYYHVILFSSVVSLLSVSLFTLTAAIPQLRPPACLPGSTTCESPSAGHMAVFYTAVILLAIGAGGSRFNMLAMGASQFDEPSQQDVFFNWFFIVLYVSMIVGGTVVVYIQDSISWTLGFGIAVACNVVSIGLFLVGARYFRKPPPQGSPFTSLARVVVAAIKKRKVNVESMDRSIAYYPGSVDENVEQVHVTPSQRFRFLNRATIPINGDTNQDGSIKDPWRLCTVQQVEELKAILSLLPLWSSSIFLSISIGVLISLSVLQDLTMVRRIANTHITIPASSFVIFNLAAVAISLVTLDRAFFPLLHKLIEFKLTSLQRIGLGHLLNVIGLIAAALVEKKRSNIVHENHAEGQATFIVPMSAMWLVLQLGIAGVGEALHFPAQVALYIQELPTALAGTATGMVAVLIAIGFYLSTVVIDLVRRATDWLPDNINGARLEYVYWLVTILAGINFGYYLLCASLYKRETSVNDQVPGEQDLLENR